MTYWLTDCWIDWLVGDSQLSPSQSGEASEEATAPKVPRLTSCASCNKHLTRKCCLSPSNNAAMFIECRRLEFIQDRGAGKYSLLLLLYSFMRDLNARGIRYDEYDQKQEVCVYVCVCVCV